MVFVIYSNLNNCFVRPHCKNSIASSYKNACFILLLHSFLFCVSILCFRPKRISSFAFSPLSVYCTIQFLLLKNRHDEALYFNHHAQSTYPTHTMLSFIPGTKRPAYICALLKALATLSSAILLTPRLRLLESNVCRSHYQTFNSTAIDHSTNNVAEELCKIEPVQADLAFLLGWNSFFQNVPSTWSCHYRQAGVWSKC